MKSSNSLVCHRLSVRWSLLFVAAVFAQFSDSANKAEARMTTVQAVELNAAGEEIAQFDMLMERHSVESGIGGSDEDGTSDATLETIYRNTNLLFPVLQLLVDPASEYVDYGTSDGGNVQSFRVGYTPPFSGLIHLDIRFYRDVSYNHCPTSGDLIKYFRISVIGSSSSENLDTYVIPEQQRFQLPPGAFGYSYQIVESNTDLIQASGGTGNLDDMWINPGCGFTDLGSYHAGLYMSIRGTALAPELSVDPNDLVLSCPLTSGSGCQGEEIVITNTGDAELHVEGIDAPDRLILTPPDPNVFLQPGEQVAICIEPDCSQCTGEALDGFLVIHSNDPNDPNGIRTSHVTVECGECDVPADLDGDCDDDLVDFSILEMHWMQTTCVSPDWCGGADYDTNGNVDPDDLLFLVQYWLAGTMP